MKVKVKYKLIPNIPPELENFRHLAYNSTSVGKTRFRIFFSVSIPGCARSAYMIPY